MPGPTKADLEAENAQLRAQLSNSDTATAPVDVNDLAEGQYVETADRDGSFVDSVGTRHTYSEGDSIVYNSDDTAVRVIGADDASAEADTEPAD